MGLEAGSYISDLVSANPLGTDPRNQGDDHIRLIKSVLKTTFPNIDGAVNATPTELNKLTDASNLVPEGTILMWAGSIANIPTGYQICDGTGTTSTLAIPVPNLTGKFVVHADADSGGTYNPTNTGGSGTAMSGLSVDSHTLTVDQLPSHNHTFNDTTLVQSSVTGVGVTGFEQTTSEPEAGTSTRYTFSASSPSDTTNSTGGGSSHSHNLTGTSGSTLPPYYALAYIIKL